jgi:hypothetical protein
MKNEFVIENFQVLSKGKLIARFDLTTASGITIRGMALFAKENGSRWISFPARKQTDQQTGAITWVPHVEIRDRGKMSGFRDGVIASIDALDFQGAKLAASSPVPPPAESPARTQSAPPASTPTTSPTTSRPKSAPAKTSSPSSQPGPDLTKDVPF